MTLDPTEGRRLYGSDPHGYSVGRPDYPARVYGLLAESGMGPGSTVLEIGPGTGLVTRHLLDSGAHVTAVEANQAMAVHLRAEFGDRSLKVLWAPFEKARLAAGTFDFAVAATSFHWVAQQRGWQNLIGALRPGAWAFIWWMLFEDPTALDEFDRATHHILGGSPSLPELPEAMPKCSTQFNGSSSRASVGKLKEPFSQRSIEVADPL